MKSSLVRCGLLLIASLMLAGHHGDAAPVSGSDWTRHELDPSATHRQDVIFRGGQRACVIVEGKHNPPGEISLKVYDDQGGLIGEDTQGGDYAVVIWYPARDAKARIEVLNRAKERNPIRLVVK